MVEAVFDTILAIDREGTTVLMVEQNARKALSISRRAFVLELGRNRVERTGRALLDDPEVRHHYLGGQAPPRPSKVRRAQDARDIAAYLYTLRRR